MFDLPERQGTKRPVREDLNLGYEFYKSDGELWNWTFAAAGQFVQAAVGSKPLLVDFGGASGFKAMHLAQQGCDVVVIDLVIDDRIVRERNRYLSSSYPTAASICATEKDIRLLTAQELTELCGRRAPALMTGFNFIHFLKSQELDTFFDLLSAVAAPGAKVALSYANGRSPLNASKDRPHMTFHDETAVSRLAGEKGFHLTCSESKRNGNHTGQAFASCAL